MEGNGGYHVLGPHRYGDVGRTVPYLGAQPQRFLRRREHVPTVTLDHEIPALRECVRRGGTMYNSQGSTAGAGRLQQVVQGNGARWHPLHRRPSARSLARAFTSPRRKDVRSATAASSHTRSLQPLNLVSQQGEGRRGSAATASLVLAVREEKG